MAKLKMKKNALCMTRLIRSYSGNVGVSNWLESREPHQKTGKALALPRIVAEDNKMTP
jgi:hypothetical protein